MPFLKLLFDHIRKYKEKSWLGGEKSFPSPRMASELSIMWTGSFSLSSYLKLSSLFTNKDHHHEFGGQISLPPRFLTLRLLYQPNRKEKKKPLPLQFLKLNTRDGALKPTKKFIFPSLEILYRTIFKVQILLWTT